MLFILERVTSFGSKRLLFKKSQKLDFYRYGDLKYWKFWKIKIARAKWLRYTKELNLGLIKKRWKQNKPFKNYKLYE